MTDYPYIAPCSYSIIYAHALPGSVDHAGLLKVGDTSLKSPKKPWQQLLLTSSPT